MSQNCKSGYASAQRDANNNMYSGSGCTNKSYNGAGNGGTNKAYQQQVTAKVLFGTVAAINELKLQERAAREARRTH